MLLIYIVCQNIKEAKKIGLFLLKKKLIACYNLWPIDSAYFWQGRLTKDKEAVLLLKTQAKHYKIIEKSVKRLHSYELPCIFSVKPGTIERNYKNWVIGETS